ncbi:MAG: YoaK family protein [Moheibacter sp.]
MFRYRIKNRSLKDNLRIATLLSFVAGMVNVAGFLGVRQLTTNVTGHFAFFIGEIYHIDVWRGLVYFLFVFFFLLGSFFSGVLIEWISRKNERYVYVIPVLIETLILAFVAFYCETLLAGNANLIAYLLLFAMGLQNSLVTLISNSVVRTTHLTGLFTDLGIEFSQLFFYKSAAHKKKLLSSIRLRFFIIVFFLLGGVVSGLFYFRFELRILYFSAGLLVFGLFYDQIRIRLNLLKRNIRQHGVLRKWERGE